MKFCASLEILGDSDWWVGLSSPDRDCSIGLSLFSVQATVKDHRPFEWTVKGGIRPLEVCALCIDLYICMYIYIDIYIYVYIYIYISLWLSRASTWFNAWPLPS